MNTMRMNGGGMRLAIVAVCLPAMLAVAAQARAGTPIELPQADKALLDEYLGPGVVGKAVEGKPLAEPLKLVPLTNTTWRYRFTNGDDKGKVIDHKFSALEGDPSGANWKGEVGKTDILYMRKTDDGSIEFVSHPELDTGLVTAYHPPAPLLMKGMAPGQAHKTRFDVKVYYLDNPEKEKHSGQLELTLTYVGAYEVKTPAGTFEAALIKSDYKGKVGPASVEDVQYRFFAEGIGIVAMIEEKHVSAFLLYKDNTMIGKVLEELPAAIQKAAGR